LRTEAVTDEFGKGTRLRTEGERDKFGKGTSLRTEGEKEEFGKGSSRETESFAKEGGWLQKQCSSEIQDDITEKSPTNMSGSVIPGLPDFSSHNIPKQEKICQHDHKNIYNGHKIGHYNIPNGHKIYSHLSWQDPPKFTQIGIFGFKIYHLTTLNDTVSRNCAVVVHRPVFLNISSPLVINLGSWG
jgi:hypothetical protein